MGIGSYKTIMFTRETISVPRRGVHAIGENASSQNSKDYLFRTVFVTSAVEGMIGYLRKAHPQRGTAFCPLLTRPASFISFITVVRLNRRLPDAFLVMLA